MPKEIKFWLIRVSYNYNCVEYYGAFASKNPVDEGLLPDDFLAEASEQMWDSYSWTVLGWEGDAIEGETEEEREEFVDQAHEDFINDVCFEAEESEDENPDEYEIVYDERLNND